MGVKLTDGFDISAVADVDLSSSQYCGVIKTTTGVTLPGGAGVAIYGVLQNAPIAGKTALVRVLGGTKIRANAAITVADQVAISGTDGRFKTAVSTNYRVGQCVQAATAAGDFVDAILAPNGLVA